MPSVVGVGGVIENKKALNHAAAKKYTCGCVCVSRVAEDKKAWISDPCLLTSRLWQSNLLSSSGILCASRGRAWRPSDIDPPEVGALNRQLVFVVIRLAQNIHRGHLSQRGSSSQIANPRKEESPNQGWEAAIQSSGCVGREDSLPGSHHGSTEA